MSQETVLADLTAAVAEGDRDEAVRLTQAALEAELKPMTIVDDAIQPAMDDIGDRFESGDAYLPELVMAGDAAVAALEFIIPLLGGDEGGAMKGTVVFATMFGDNHDIGKNITSAILVAHGFKVVDLGTDVPPKDVVQAAERENADIIACSTLITTSLPYQRQIVQLLRDMGRRDKQYVIVGGGPVTPEWAREIGADGYGRDANDAASLCSKLMANDQAPPLEAPLIEGALKT